MSDDDQGPLRANSGHSATTSQWHWPFGRSTFGCSGRGCWVASLAVTPRDGCCSPSRSTVAEEGMRAFLDKGNVSHCAANCATNITSLDSVIVVMYTIDACLSCRRPEATLKGQCGSRRLAPRWIGARPPKAACVTGASSHGEQPPLPALAGAGAELQKLGIGLVSDVLGVGVCALYSRASPRQPRRNSDLFPRVTSASAGRRALRWTLSQGRCRKIAPAPTAQLIAAGSREA